MGADERVVVWFVRRDVDAAADVEEEVASVKGAVIAREERYASMR